MQRRKIEKISIFNSLDVIFDFLMSWIENSNQVSIQSQYQIELECWNRVFKSSQKIDIKYLSWVRRLISKLDLMINLSSRCSLNLMSSLNSWDSLNSRSSKRKKRMSNYLSMLQNIWLICFKRFLLIALFVIFTWDMSIFKIHDYRCSLHIIFYSLIQRISWCDVYLRIWSNTLRFCRI